IGNRRGVRVPEELFLVGHNDVPFARWTELLLTTAHVYCVTEGKSASAAPQYRRCTPPPRLDPTPRPTALPRPLRVQAPHLRRQRQKRSPPRHLIRRQRRKVHRTARRTPLQHLRRHLRLADDTCSRHCLANTVLDATGLPPRSLSAKAH